MGYLYQAMTLCRTCGEAVSKWLDNLGLEDTTHANDYPQPMQSGMAHPDAHVTCGYCRDPVRHTHGQEDSEQCS